MVKDGCYFKFKYTAKPDQAVYCSAKAYSEHCQTSKMKYF